MNIKLKYNQKNIFDFRVQIENTLNALLKESDPEQIMTQMNELLGTYGIESLTDENAWVSHYWMYTIAIYLNCGDTCDTTILYDCEEKSFHIESWGNFYEEWMSKHPKTNEEDY